jgi:hypothetical protein
MGEGGTRRHTLWLPDWSAAQNVEATQAAGSRLTMLMRKLHDAGLRDLQLQIMSVSAICLCIALWMRAKTVDQDERGNAERRALFVGLWPPTIWLIGDSLGRVSRRR